MLPLCLFASLAVTTACSGRVAASWRNAFFKYFLLFKVLSIHKNYQLIFEGGGGGRLEYVANQCGDLKF